MSAIENESGSLVFSLIWVYILYSTKNYVFYKYLQNTNKNNSTIESIL